MLSTPALLEVVGLTSTVIAVAGTVLNNRRRRECFYLWLVSNSMTLCVHLAAGLFSLAARDAIFFLLAVQGLRSWTAQQKGRSSL